MSEIDFSEVEAAEAEPTPTPESAATEAAAPAEEAAAPKYAELDAVLPDVEDLDDDVRGKPLKEVLRVAKQHKEEAKRAYAAGAELNTLKSRLDMAERLIASQQRHEAPQQPDPQELLGRLAADPYGVLSELTRQQVEPLMRKIDELSFGSYQSQAEMARKDARPANVDPKVWEGVTPSLAAIMAARKMEPTRENWAAAFDTYKEQAALLVPRVSVPAPAPPPTGQARSTPARTNAPRLTARDERNLAELAELSGIKKGTPAWDRLVNDITSDPYSMGSM